MRPQSYDQILFEGCDLQRFIFRISEGSQNVVDAVNFTKQKKSVGIGLRLPDLPAIDRFFRDFAGMVGQTRDNIPHGQTVALSGFF